LIRFSTAIKCLLLPLVLSGSTTLRSMDRERFFEYSEAQGLSERNINALTQDRDGFLYVGTANGLFRFDGSNFSPIPFSGGVAAPCILSLAPHPQGGVWAGTLDGLAWVRGMAVQWATFKGTDSKLEIHNLALDITGTCWVPNRRGMFVEKRPLQFELDPASTPWHPKISVATARLGGDIVVLDGDLVLHRRDFRGAWTHQSCPEFKGKRPKCLTLDRRGRVWCLLGQQIWRSDKPGAPFCERRGWLKGVVSDEADFFPDAAGGLWIPTNSGLLQIEDAPTRWIAREKGLPDAEFTEVFLDASGNFWYGGQGLFRRIDRGWFRVHSPLKAMPGLIIQKVHQGQRSGRLFAGTPKGLFVLEGEDLKLVPGTSGLRIYSLHEDRQGDLWISTAPEGFWCLPRGHAVVQLVRGPKGITNGKFAEGPDGSVYIHDGTQPAYRIHGAAAAVNFEPLETPLPPGRKSPTSEGLAFDSQARMWVGSYYGLHVKDGSNWRSFTTRDGLLHDSIAQLCPGPAGTLWVRYEQPIGVSRVTFADGHFQVLEHLGSPSPLPTGNILDMAANAQGDLWLLTNLGALRWSNGAAELFNQADGLPPNSFKGGGLFISQRGYLWMGIGQDLIACHPGQPPTRIEPPVARVTAFGTARRTWMLPTDPTWGSIPARDATLTFHFASSSPDNLGNERFQIFLEGLEDTWRDSVPTSAHYAHLKGGTYTFHVRAARRGGPWGPSSTLQVRVLPPWYRTWWATLAAGVGVLLVFRAWVLLRLRRLLKQRHHLEGLVTSRTLDLNHAMEALREQSMRDPLTGLHNRRFIQMVIHQDLKKAMQHYRHSATNGRRGDLQNPDVLFFLVDLDHFKYVNDLHGHAAGDLILQQSAAVLQQAMRDTDSVVRWGGEEFLLVARDSDRLEGAHIAERVRSYVADHPFDIGGGQIIKITCSVGFSPFPCNPDDHLDEASWEQVLDLADKCLYFAKHSGRNGWVGIARVDHPPPLPWDHSQLQDVIEKQQVDLRHSFSSLNFAEMPK